jgi:uncharacterized coiled-coil protein SlyX
VVVQARSAVESVEQRADELETRLDEQQATLDDLTGRAVQQLSEAHRRDDAILEALEHPNFSAVQSALRMVAASNAISRVYQARCTPAFGGLRLRLDHATFEAPGPRAPGEDVIVVRVSGRSLDVAVDITDVWKPEEDLVAVLGRVHTELERRNVDASETTFDGSYALRAWRHGVSTALHALRGTLPRRLGGPLIEQLTDDLVITEAGIESLLLGVIAPVGMFARELLPGRSPTRQAAVPRAPAGVDTETWHEALRVAEELLPVARGPRAGWA